MVDDRVIVALEAIDKCIKCGICRTHCPVVSGVSSATYPGPMHIAIDTVRATHELSVPIEMAYCCTTCQKCVEVCPMHIDLSEIIQKLRCATYQFETLTNGQQKLLEVVRKYNYAVAPAQEMLETSYVSKYDKYMAGEPPANELIYFPGCIAAHRRPDIVEATIRILACVGITTYIPSNWVCCGSPIAKLGATDTHKLLIAQNAKWLAEYEPEIVITSCPGCTVHLHKLFGNEYRFTHIIEYLYEDVGINKLQSNIWASVVDSSANKFGYNIKIGVHYPCHIYRAQDPAIMHEAIDLLQHLPGIRYVELSDAERCCGAGGGALASMPDVPIALRTAKLQSVSAANVDCLIAPCPLCVLNLNLGIIDDYNKLNFKVEDITTFIKRYIK